MEAPLLEQIEEERNNAYKEGFKEGDKNGYDRAIAWFLERDTAILEKVYKAHEQALKEEHLAGEKKVVEWIGKHSQLEKCDPAFIATFNDYRWMDELDWQAFLQSAGIE